MSCIIVLGCYRSGTSAVAGILNHLEIFMGEIFDPPTQNNIHGYFEDIEFKNFHKKFDAGELEIDVNPLLINDYVDLIRKRENEHKIWGIKDPLLCTNLKRFWTNLKTDHKLIVCRRKSKDIATSMARAMQEKDENLFLPLVEFYIRNMQEQISEYKNPILEMNHEETISNPEFHIQRIADFLQIPITQRALEHIKK